MHTGIWRRIVLENALDAVVGVDHEDQIIDWNRQAEQTFGWLAKEAIGSAMADILVPPEFRDAYRIEREKLLSTGPEAIPNRRIELQALHRDGRRILIEVTVIPIQVHGAYRVYSFARDIGAARKTQSQLKLLSDALENSLNAFDIVDAEGRFIYANRTYLKMWGYERLEEILGTSPADHCEDPAIPGRIIAELKARGECEIEFVARRRDGSTFDVLMWARLAHDAEGREVYPTTAIDITERKRAETALKEAIRTRDEFISICSHELRTPVTSMRLQFQVAARQLERGDEEAISRKAIAKRIANSNRQLDRMTNLIEDMLDVSRIAAGKLHLKRETVDLGGLCEEVVERFQDHYSLLGLSLVFENPRPGTTVTVDPYRMEQVLSNLFTNAVKYGAGGPVRVSLEVEAGSVRLRVKDHGIGIAPENLERIFDRFERAVPSDNIGGLGLGLYISRQIVETHGGRIWAESETGRGSTFVVELPLTT